MRDCEKGRWFWPEIESKAAVIGLGPMGARMTRIVARNNPHVACHNLLFPPAGGDPETLPTVLCAARGSNLLILLAGMEESRQGVLLQRIGAAARKQDLPTIAVVSDGGEGRPVPPEEMEIAREAVDCLFMTSAASLVPSTDFLAHPKNRGALAGYAMRHMVATISALIARRSIICIDFADIREIIRAGRVARLGSGVATGPQRGRTAALLACDRLAEQRAMVADAKGIIACVNGSSDMSMKDYDQATAVIHERIHENVNVVIGCITDEDLRTNVKVSILMVA